MVKLNIDLPEDFLNEEIRCDYKVTRKMKEVWAVELDLLNQLLYVCKKHGIRIFASGGTMLGAVRHKGFIPWDDDIDMMMRREDYNKLCEVAPEEFTEPYFFQTEWTDTGSLRGHAQLRRSDTTGILTYEKGREDINQGIFIDIFPLDNVIENQRKFYRQGRKVCLYKKIAFFLYLYVRNYASVKKSLKHTFVHITANVMNCFMNYDFWYRKMEKECQRYNCVKTEMFSSLSFMFFEKKHIKQKADYKTLTDFPFEFMSIPVGTGFEHALTLRYGAWHEFEKGTSCHGGIIFDTDKPYKKYIEENHNRKCHITNSYREAAQ